MDYCLHRSEDDPNVFMLYENWRSQRDLEKHLQMPYVAKPFISGLLGVRFSRGIQRLEGV